MRKIAGVLIAIAAMSLSAPLAHAANYYVNNTSTTNDEYCTAIGATANDGISAATPKLSVQAIIDTYDLGPGDIVYIDTGTYTLTADITIGSADQGSALGMVRFVGATGANGSTGTIINRNNTSSAGVYIYNADYVALKNLRVKNAETGIYFDSSVYCSVSGCRAYSNAGTGIHLRFGSSNATLDHNLTDNNSSYGIYLHDSDNSVVYNNTSAYNGSSAIYINYYASNASLRNNILAHPVIAIF